MCQNKRQSIFDIITGRNESKTLTNTYLVNGNAISVAENVTQIKFGIKIDVGGSAKILENVLCTKKVIFGILLHLLVKTVNI